MDRVVAIATATGRNFKTITNLHTLNRLDAHDCLSKQRINFAIPVNMRTESNGDSIGKNLNDAT